MTNQENLPKGHLSFVTLLFIQIPGVIIIIIIFLLNFFFVCLLLSSFQNDGVMGRLALN